MGLFSKKSGEPRPRLAHRLFGASLGSAVLFFVEVLQIMVIAAAIIIPIRLFLVKPFIVKGASMEPNFHDDEYLIIDEISYQFKDVERGEIVVFHPPNDPSQFYIKRVIGLPGETVEIDDGVITISNDQYPNGVAISESYIDEYTHGRVRVTLGLDEYYLMGDNRDSSLDSRKFGPVPQQNIVGKVWLRGLPIENAGVITKPQYDL